MNGCKTNQNKLMDRKSKYDW